MEDFVTFKMARKLKEKGFPQTYMGKYDMLGPTYIEDGRLFENGCIVEVATAYTAPTIWDVLKWLREEKKIHIEPCILVDGDIDADGKLITYYTYWSFSIISIESGKMIYYEYEYMNDRRFNSFEEASLSGIEYTLDNLI